MGQSPPLIPLRDLISTVCEEGPRCPETYPGSLLGLFSISTIEGLVAQNGPHIPLSPLMLGSFVSKLLRSLLRTAKLLPTFHWYSGSSEKLPLCKSTIHLYRKFSLLKVSLPGRSCSGTNLSPETLTARQPLRPTFPPHCFPEFTAPRICRVLFASVAHPVIKASMFSSTCKSCILM